MVPQNCSQDKLAGSVRGAAQVEAAKVAERGAGRECLHQLHHLVVSDVAIPQVKVLQGVIDPHHPGPGQDARFTGVSIGAPYKHEAQ